jgi:hypothetical protein
MDWHRHHLFFAVVAIIVAAAFLAWFAPQIGFLAR